MSSDIPEKTDKMAAARAAKVAKREAQTRDLDSQFAPLSDDELKKLTPDEINLRRARLTAAIDSLPPVSAAVATIARPGTKVGEGMAQDVVPFTAEWFTDIPARQKEDPNYQMHEILPTKWGFVKVNGVAFGYAPNKRCLLPTPHYIVYLDNLTAAERQSKDFQPPENPQRTAGYMSNVHIMSGQWQYTPLPTNENKV
jgi:hypothetical protein